MKRFWISLIAASLVAIAAIAPAAAESHTLTIDLDEVNGSGVSGTATLTEENGETMVEISLDGTPEEGVHPVHIHAGTCDDLGDVVFPLEDVIDGTSESTVEASLDDILADDHAINVHLSEDQMDVYVACGNIEDDDAVVDDDDDAVVDDDDDAVVDDDDDAVVDDDDDAVVDDDDDAMVDDDDDVAVDDTDDAVVDDEEDDAEDLVPATGSVSDGLGANAGALLLVLAAAGTMGAGMLLRRRIVRA